MPLFRRRRPDPPDWAGFLDPDDWHEFSELVRYEADRRRWPHDLALGFVVHAGTTMGLGNLAQVCHGAPRDEWPTLVAAHFATLDKDHEVRFESAEHARAVLRARLIDDDFTGGRDIELAGRGVGDDLRVVLAYDLPDTVHLPSRSDVLEWGDEDELIELALEEGPGSLSDGLYWLRDGFLERLETRVEGENIIFAPSDELTDVLNRLE
jgi:hypothetical protein